ncbi:G:T-mismatch repair DNA endonuclease (very short patch repair protein) [Rhizobium sp. BK313]|nr:G:T-mismatch repair DNA endonuclease (very short patch repair protein) [Rhizobium sp. BK313]
MASTPKTRAEFWQAKFDANVARDKRNVADLEHLGWKVHVIWECQTKRPEDLSASLNTLLRELDD